MEQTKKYLKLSSIAVLALAGFSMLQVVYEMFFGELSNAIIPEGAPDNILLITRIFIFSFALLLMLPGIYIGIKGVRMAKKPNSSKGHIVWGIILLVLTFLSLISPVVDIINNGFKYDYISEFLRIAIEVIAFFEYIKYAIALRKAIA
jgi:uncharacterized membrane protein HdeD (DUF308 family)